MRAHVKLKGPPICDRKFGGGSMAMIRSAIEIDISPAHMKISAGVLPLRPMRPFMKGR